LHCLPYARSCGFHGLAAMPRTREPMQGCARLGKSPT
jgi:hypothetical protein